MPLPIRLVVVSCPATISWKIVDSISCRFSASRSSAARTRSVTRSSPGSTRLRSSSSVRYRTMFAEAATALGGGSGAEAGASRVVNQAPSSARSGSGTPSSSLITVNGSGKAKPATRSTTVSPRLCSSSSRSSTIGLDAGPQRGDPRPAERGRGQPAQPGVVGRVDAEHVPGERGAGQALGDHRAVAGERGVHVLGQPRVVERGPGLGVPDDEPGPLPVGQRDLVHRAVGPDLREQRERVVAVVVAPRVERRITHRRPPSIGPVADLAEAGTQQVEGGQPVAGGLADQRLRAGPAGGP